MPQVGNLSYNPSKQQPGSAIQSAPNQIQTLNAYQSHGLISSEPRPALYRPQEQRPIQVNPNYTYYQWGPTLNVNQPREMVNFLCVCLVLNDTSTLVGHQRQTVLN